MMEAEAVSETAECNSKLTRQIAWEILIAFGRRKSLKLY
jgi:hypothetical protein